MSTIQIPGTHTLFVRWSCRRCGHKGGVAKTTVPLPFEALNEVAMRELFSTLRRKLVKKHQLQNCVATVEDFRIERGTPEDARIVGLV